MALFQSATQSVVHFLQGLEPPLHPQQPQQSLQAPQPFHQPAAHVSPASADPVPVPGFAASGAARPPLPLPSALSAARPLFGPASKGVADALSTGPVLQLVHRSATLPAGNAICQASLPLGQARPDSSLRSRALAATAQCQQRVNAPPKLSVVAAWAPAAMPHAVPAVRVRCRPESLECHGGLVIAGRLEDVCAELDRLVALQELH